MQIFCDRISELSSKIFQYMELGSYANAWVKCKCYFFLFEAQILQNKCV